MKTTHTGKIGRLPKPIQHQLNRRLENGEPGRSLVAWLNALPEVQAVLQAHFAGKPIREQNLSQWRQYGYREWLDRQEALQAAPALLAQSSPPQSDAGAPPLTDQLVAWLSVRYLMAVRQLEDHSTSPHSALKILRQFCRDLVALRRGEHAAARLKLRQQMLAARQSNANN